MEWSVQFYLSSRKEEKQENNINYYLNFFFNSSNGSQLNSHAGQDQKNVQPPNLWGTINNLILFLITTYYKIMIVL
jgi:hypothetical protein